MKRKIAFIVLVVMLFNFISAILPSRFSSVYAEGLEGSFGDVQEYQSEHGKESFNEAYSSGTASTYPNGNTSGNKNSLEPPSGIWNTLATAVCNFLVLIPSLIHSFIGQIVLEGQGEFLIQDLLTNNYDLFNIDIFEIQETQTSSQHFVDTNNKIKENIAIWYYSLRNLAAIGSIVVLIYVGIRMAISTLANDRVKYRKMLMSWFVAVILIFLLHYIILIFIKLSNLIVNILSETVTNGVASSLEETLVVNIFDKMGRAKGWSKLWMVISYWMIVYYQVKFFIMYFKRFLEICFYMMISPLVCLIYPIDKVGDNRSQSFKTWLKEISLKIFIQPIHLLLYLIFIYSAGEIAELVPILGVIFFMALSNGEKIIRNSFKLGKGGLKDTKIGGKKK